MHSDDPQFTDPAMDVIRKYDPATYAEIMSDNYWRVHVRPVAGEGDGETQFAISTQDGQFVLPRSKRDSILDRGKLEREARENGITVAEQTASVLVHEFRHHVDGTREEHPAYTASVLFDRRLPDSGGGLLDYDLLGFAATE